MKRFIEGVDRFQATLFPERLEGWIEDDNPVRVIDVFAEGLDPSDLGLQMQRRQAGQDIILRSC